MPPPLPAGTTRVLPMLLQIGDRPYRGQVVERHAQGNAADRPTSTESSKGRSAGAPCHEAWAEVESAGHAEGDLVDGLAAPGPY